MGDWIDRLFNQYKFVRRIIVLWAMWLITLVVLRAISDLGAVTASVAAMVGSVIGILSVVLGFYFQNRKDEP